MLRRFAARVVRIIRSNDGAVAIQTPLNLTTLPAAAAICVVTDLSRARPQRGASDYDLSRACNTIRSVCCS